MESYFVTPTYVLFPYVLTNKTYVGVTKYDSI